MIFNHFGSNCSYLKWLKKQWLIWCGWQYRLHFGRRILITKFFRSLCWKFVERFFMELKLSWHQNIWLKWLFYQKNLETYVFGKLIFYWPVVNWRKINYHYNSIRCWICFTTKLLWPKKHIKNALSFCG